MDCCHGFIKYVRQYAWRHDEATPKGQDHDPQGQGWENLSPRILEVKASSLEDYINVL